MSETIGERIRELREVDNLSQKEFAEKIGLVEEVINNWEEGSSIPTRNKIFKIGEFFGLDGVGVNELLDLAGHDLLPLEVIASSGLTVLDWAAVDFITRTDHYISSSGTSMGLALNDLGFGVDALEKSLLQKDFEALAQDVKHLEDVVVPQFQEVYNELVRHQDFIKQNADIFRTAVTAEGQLNSLQKNQEALEKRLSHMETKINIRWDRNVAVVAAFIAFLSVLVAAVSCAASIYIGFVK